MANSSISEIIAGASKAGGLTQPSQFNVEFNLPKGHPFGHQSSLKQIMMSCEQAVLPSKSINTTQMGYYGPDLNYAYSQNFADLDMVFRVHNNMVERQFFESWQEVAVNPNTYDANYYDEYVARIVIRQYDGMNIKAADGTVLKETLATYTLIDAFPKFVSSLALEHSSTNTYHKQQVTFEYRKWKAEFPRRLP